MKRMLRLLLICDAEIVLVKNLTSKSGDFYSHRSTASLVGFLQILHEIRFLVNIHFFPVRSLSLSQIISVNKSDLGGREAAGEADGLAPFNTPLINRPHSVLRMEALNYC